MQALTLFVTIVASDRWISDRPSRRELGARIAHLTFEPVALDPAGFAGMRVAGAWTVTSDDPRFGGVSALAVDPAGLLALTDWGVIIRFPRPRGRNALASIRELPGGPGDPRYKSSRDSEALVRDPLGRGWWVGFEVRNQLWRYDRDFRRPLEALRFGKGRWRRNRGIEALASDGSALLLIPESGRSVIRITGGSQLRLPIENPRGRLSDAVRLPSGRLAVVHRNWTLAGFSNTLSTLQRTARGYRIVGTRRLGVGVLDNVEALASERLADGRVRLWLMTDNNFQRPLRTLLVAVDLPQAAG